MNKVIVYRSSLLPPSETFIKQQIIGLKRWQALLTGKEFVVNGLSLDGLETLLVKDFYSSRLRKFKWRLFTLLGWLKLAGYKKLIDYRPSLIHAHFGVDAVFAWPWLKYLQIPMVVTLHGYDISIRPEWWKSGQGGEYMRSYPDALKALANDKRVSFLAVSNAIKQKAIDLYGIQPEKINVSYIGIDHTAFVPGGQLISTRPRQVLFVGRLVEKKGAAILINAMMQVQKQLPDAELVMIGDGPLRKSLEELAAQLNISARFLGVLPSNSIREHMHQARVFCLPSITASNGDTEGLPIVLLEAQASSLPVITSASGGRDEGIADGITGFSFAEHDVTGLSELLIRVLQDDELAENMSKAGPKFILDNFTLAKCTSVLETYYDQLSLGKSK